MVGIALTSGPRFALVGLYYLLTARHNSSLPKMVLWVGIFRTFTCGGWTYVTSTDDHNWHDIFMLSYLVATIPWTMGCLAISPPNPKAIKYRKILAGMFFGALVPSAYFFLQHKVHKVAGGERSKTLSTDGTNSCSIFSLRYLRVGPCPSRCWFRRRYLLRFCQF